MSLEKGNLIDLIELYRVMVSGCFSRNCSASSVLPAPGTCRRLLMPIKLEVIIVSD